MSRKHEVTIEYTGKEHKYRITWSDITAGTRDYFDTSAAEISAKDVEILWQYPDCQARIGEKLFRFLDGDSRFLQRALDEAEKSGEILQLDLRTPNAAADWPFELLAKSGGFLLHDSIHLVRRVSEWGTDAKIIPENRPLRLLFMACSARGIKPELDYEREEEAIFRVTEKLAVDMEVEDSGSLAGLKERLEHRQYDVIHISGHADIDEKGNPFFVMEDETGSRRDVSPGDLWNEALIQEPPPRLLFLSGCRTGEAPQAAETPDKAALSFARLLVERHRIPTVLGWGRPVSDDQATHAEEMIYHELSCGKTILQSLLRARYELKEKFSDSRYPAWPLLRLFASGMPLTAVVKPGQPQRPIPRRMTYFSLGDSGMRVLREGFIGRRRQLQIALHTLKNDFEKAGVLLLGAGGLGKSCLAGKICERFKDRKLIIVHGKLDNISLQAAMKDGFIQSDDNKAQRILAQKKEMTEKIAELCAHSFREKNYLILLDDFEQNLEGAEAGQPRSLHREAADLLLALLQHLPKSGKMTQLIITSRYEFSLTKGNKNLVEERLQPIYLTGFRETEQRKKEQELKNILEYAQRFPGIRLLAEGRGNPFLMEQLDQLLEQKRDAKEAQLKQEIRNCRQRFIEEFGMRKILEKSGGSMKWFLSRMSIYRRFVGKDGVRQVNGKEACGNPGELLQEAVRLSLIEYDQERQGYRVTPLLRDELSSVLEDPRSVHEQALAYYKKVCAESEAQPDPVMAEELTYHALCCGEEETASRVGAGLVRYYHERLDFKQAKRIGLEILQEKKQELQTVHDTLLLNEIASTLKELTEYDKAIDLYEKAYMTTRSLYGAKHSEAARSLNNQAVVWSAKGDYNKAVELYEQALEIVREAPQENPPEAFGIIMQNLGTALNALGHPERSIEIYEQVLAAWNDVHDNARLNNKAILLGNLAAAAADCGDQNKARRYYQEALAIFQALYKGDHPDKAGVLNNLAASYYQEGDYLKAAEYYEQVRAMWQAIYGEEHPNAADAARSLAAAREASGNSHWDNRPGKTIKRIQR